MSETDQRWIPSNPKYRAGMYKRLDQVPDHLRLSNYERRFENRDCWAEYATEEGLVDEGLSENHKSYMERTERRWKSFTEGRGTHHALCTPEDAEAYATHLVDNFPMKIETASEYWADHERFYRWMFFNAEYPHRYHPFVMAATNYDTSRVLWKHAIQKK